MTIGNSYNFAYSNNYPVFRNGSNSGIDVIAKPIEKVENVINSTVDTISGQPQNEEHKKSKKTAITVGSSVLVLSAAIALLNPKFSSKLINKLKTISQKAGNKGDKYKNNFMKGKFYNLVKNLLMEP